MTPQAQLALILWLPIVLYFFKKYPPQKAMIISFLGGLLFLPQRTKFLLPLIPDYGGMVATCYAIFFAIIIFDPQRLNKFKLSWIDLPIILFGTAHLFSSLTNGLGLYDGINQSITQTVKWGMPYFLGRLYLTNFSGFKILAIAIVQAGLIYTPFVLYEIRMSPQLHRMVYGYFPHSFAQTIRYGGWRPQVFMQHGLMLGLFMMTASLVAIWLWQGKVVQKIWGLPIKWVSLILFVTFIFCKSTGAYGLMLFGLTIMLSAKLIRLNLPLILLMLGIIGYLFLSASGSIDREQFISFVSNYANPERVQSLDFRLKNEELLSEKARQQIMFGWGGWGGNRIFEENWAGELVDISVTDSLWIIIFGVNGLWGLINWTVALLLPVFYSLSLRIPVKEWFNSKVASVSVLGVALTLFVVDCLFNDMFNPIFPLIAGGLSGLSVSKLNYSQNKIKKIRIIRKSEKLLAYKKQKRIS